MQSYFAFQWRMSDFGLEKAASSVSGQLFKLNICSNCDWGRCRYIGFNHLYAHPSPMTRSHSPWSCPAPVWPFCLCLTLEGIGVARDEVLQLKAVGANVLKGFSFHGNLVALLHLPCAAGRTLVLANQQAHIWERYKHMDTDFKPVYSNHYFYLFLAYYRKWRLRWLVVDVMWCEYYTKKKL